jgi:glycosyltransferase involved in cell wall biosynthesis
MRIFFGYPAAASFIDRDLRILRTEHNVVARRTRHFNPLKWIADFFAILGSRVVFFWFASLWHIPYWLAAIFCGKRIVTVVGGYEAANRPDIGYGQARPGLKRVITRLMLASSDLVLAVSESSRQEITDNLEIAADDITLVYHGFEDSAGETARNKEQLVINIGNIDATTWRKKCIADYIRLAEQLRTVRFVQIGRQKLDPEREFGRRLPVNLKLVGQVPFERLGEYLSRAKVCVQLSRHESFGCSVAEAMLFEAIPVVSDAGALPEVVGDCGAVVPVNNLDEAIKLVRTALAAPASQGSRARQHILEAYSYDKRRERLLELIGQFRRQRRRRRGQDANQVKISSSR